MGFQTLLLRFRYKVHFGIWKISKCSKTDFPWNILILEKYQISINDTRLCKLPYKVELNVHLFVKVCWEISTLTQHHLSLHYNDAIKIIKISFYTIAGILWTHPIPGMGVILHTSSNFWTTYCKELRFYMEIEIHRLISKITK